MNAVQHKQSTMDAIIQIVMKEFHGIMHSNEGMVNLAVWLRMFLDHFVNLNQ
jgi:hypothetical protein